MRFLADEDTVAKAKFIAHSIDPRKILQMTAQLEYISPIDHDVEIGKPLDPDTRFENDLGVLNCFPLEILLEIVEHLDVPSAMDFSLANHMAHHVVARSSMTFLKKWAPGLPNVLWFARIPRRFAVWELKEAIRSTYCISCGDRASWIWLAEMVRCCSPCMQNNPACWCLTKIQTTAAFALPLDELEKIPPIFAVGWRDDDPRAASPPSLLDPPGEGAYGCWVYPIKRTLARAMELYGSREAIKTAAGEIRAGIKDPKFAVVPGGAFLPESDYDGFRGAHLEPLTQAQLHNPEYRHHWTFPSLANGGIFSAPIVPRAQTQLLTYTCRGCVSMLLHPHIKALNDEEKGWLNIDLSLTAPEAYLEVYRRAYCMRSEDEMAEHIRSECLGGLSLIYGILILARRRSPLLLPPP